MRVTSVIAAASALWLLGSAGAFAGVELGAPEFPNYLTSVWPSHDTCDWWTSAYNHACPVAVPVVVVPAPALVTKAPVKGR